MSMYLRAQDDARPGSIAHPDPCTSQWGSVALSETVSRSASGMLGLQSSVFPEHALPRPSRLLGVGEKRNTFKVERLDENEYRFTQQGKTLSPGKGAVLDKESVLRAIERLHVLYPEEVPRLVFHGDALAHGSLPARHVRTCLESKGTVLIETENLGDQCLKSAFGKYFRGRAERVARVNIAARAHADGRPNSIAFLKPHEYLERSTSRGVI